MIPVQNLIKKTVFFSNFESYHIQPQLHQTAQKQNRPVFKTTIITTFMLNVNFKGKQGLNLETHLDEKFVP